jgi:hypothetical protein
MVRFAEVVRLSNGKSIKPGGTGNYPAYGSNGRIGRAVSSLKRDASDEIRGQCREHFVRGMEVEDLARISSEASRFKLETAPSARIGIEVQPPLPCHSH